MIKSFSQFAYEAYGFLESHYGFWRVQPDEWHPGYLIARWENEDVFVVTIFDAPRSGEMALKVGQLKMGESSTTGYELRTMAKVAGIPLKDLPFFRARDEETLKTAVQEMAGLLLKYGEKLLRNDAEAFRAIDQQYREDIRAYNEPNRIARAAVQAAEEAMIAKDYQTVITLMEPYKHAPLGRAKRLYDFALKQLEDREKPIHDVE